MENKAVSHMLVLAFIENLAAYLVVAQRDLDECHRMLDSIGRYLVLMHECPAIQAGNTRISRRRLAELLGEREED